MIRKLFASLLAPALLLGFAPTVQAQDRISMIMSKMPEEDMSALMRFALPPVFAQLQDRCAPHIPADSYIYSNGNELTARFEEAAFGTDAVAIQALAKLGGEEERAFTDMLDNMPIEVVGPFVKEFIAAELGSEITPDSCAPINRAMELLDPMPTENVTDLFAFFFKFMAEDEMKEAARKDG